jgi:hypothetical protein
MDIESNGSHYRLLPGSSTMGAGGRHDNYGSALAAQMACMVSVSVAWQGVLPFLKAAAERWRLFKLRPRKSVLHDSRRPNRGDTAIRLRIDDSLVLSMPAARVRHLPQNGSQTHCAALRIGEPRSNQIIPIYSSRIPLSVNLPAAVQVRLARRN